MKYAVIRPAGIDRCHVNNGGCDHECVNIFDNYFCRCQAGYALINDKSCLGNSHHLWAY